MTCKSPVKLSTFTTQMDSSLQKFGFVLAGGDPQSIARAVLSEPTIREHVVRKIAKEVDDKCAQLCRWHPILVKASLTKMEESPWEWFVQELETKCPVLHWFLVTVLATQTTITLTRKHCTLSSNLYGSSSSLEGMQQRDDSSTVIPLTSLV